MFHVFYMWLYIKYFCCDYYYKVFTSSLNQGPASADLIHFAATLWMNMYTIMQIKSKSCIYMWNCNQPSEYGITIFWKAIIVGIACINQFYGLNWDRGKNVLDKRDFLMMTHNLIEVKENKKIQKISELMTVISFQTKKKRDLTDC